jgi:hypothetical protein
MSTWIKQLLEYVGGERDTPPPGFSLSLTSVWWGIWWGLLACLIALFCGQGSKFIYIDF